MGIQNSNEVGIPVFPVLELFDSIQGEGGMIGVPVTFVRLAGCNLACPWCDTAYSQDIPRYPEGEGITWMTATQIAEAATQEYVVFTGGEPTMYDLTECVQMLHLMQKSTCVETNGTLKTTVPFKWITCSPKPGLYQINLDWVDEVKLVVTDELTERVLMDIMRETDDSKPEIWLQPNGFDMQNSWKRCYELAMKYPDRLRVGVQLHKLMEVR